MRKVCPVCKVAKSPNEFGGNRARYGGLQGHCRICRSRRAKIYYRDNREKITARIKKYLGTVPGHLARVFLAMNSRCNNPDCGSFKHYGGRDIKNKFNSLDDFRDYVINELKVDPRRLQIDRINNDGHYEEGNIRFVTAKVNSNNRRNSK